MTDTTEHVVSETVAVMFARPSDIARYKLTVVVPALLFVVLFIIGLIIALTTEDVL